MTVLIVEDDSDQLLIRTLLFTQCGFEVLSATSPAEAANAAESTLIDCAVMDLRLPTEQDGIRLLHSLKATYPTLAVYVLTGSRPELLASRPELAQADGVFAKGKSSSRLLDELRQLEAHLQDV